MFVCVCVRERERERERERKKEKKRERESACVRERKRKRKRESVCERVCVRESESESERENYSLVRFSKIIIKCNVPAGKKLWKTHAHVPFSHPRILDMLLSSVHLSFSFNTT